MCSMSLANGFVKPHGNVIVIYNVNHWAKPKIPHSRLFVFDNFENATHYMGSVSFSKDWTLWECELHNALPMPKMPCLLEKEILKYWQGLTASALELVKTPHGTLGCDAVKLIKQIEIRQDQSIVETPFV